MSVTINGTNGVTFNNGSTQAISGGMGTSATAQTWQDVTGSRALSTNYTNSTGYPIMISVWMDAGTGVGGNRTINILVNGVVTYYFGYYTTTGNNIIGGNLIIPNGATYQVNSSGANVTQTLNTWYELR